MANRVTPVEATMQIKIKNKRQELGIEAKLVQVRGQMDRYLKELY